MGEHIHTNASQHIARDCNHNSVIGIGSDHADNINSHHQAKHTDKAAQIRVLLANERYDIVVDQGFQEIAAGRGRQGTDQVRDYYTD